MRLHKIWDHKQMVASRNTVGAPTRANCVCYYSSYPDSAIVPLLWKDHSKKWGIMGDAPIWKGHAAMRSANHISNLRWIFQSANDIWRFPKISGGYPYWRKISITKASIATGDPPCTQWGSETPHVFNGSASALQLGPRADGWAIPLPKLVRWGPPNMAEHWKHETNQTKHE